MEAPGICSFFLEILRARKFLEIPILGHESDHPQKWHNNSGFSVNRVITYQLYSTSYFSSSINPEKVGGGIDLFPCHFKSNPLSELFTVSHFLFGEGVMGTIL